MQNNNFNNGAANNNSNNNGGFIMSTGTINTVDLFADVVKAGLEEAHPECSVMVHKVTKNNDLVLTGISIRSREVNIAPTIYMDDYYNDYKNGRPVMEIIAEIENIYDTYKVVYKFLTDILDIPPSDAEIEAHLLEHDISKNTRKKLKKFMKMFLLKMNVTLNIECINLLKKLFLKLMKF